ncbi:hypothetical protein FHS32_000605 [Streptomyces albaduncus]|uniref:Uncharacterized protein n=1 Tax=Streptomyces griseoloalbus TaxID=67303 RepID=A0A7W8BIB5_9ACTN|nr:hypothetical protein [Streptomyces albaduncus]GGW77912.1 hypothetical protein GCM10010340_65630 [Streptomyces albaduncus]
MGDGPRASVKRTLRLAAPVQARVTAVWSSRTPEVLAAEIVEDLQAALEEFAAIAETLQQARGEGPTAEAAPVVD